MWRILTIAQELCVFIMIICAHAGLFKICMLIFNNTQIIFIIFIRKEQYDEIQRHIFSR